MKLVTGLSPAQEWAIQTALRDRLMARAEGQLRKAIYVAMLQFGYEAMGNRDYGKVLLKHQKDLTKILVPTWQATMDEFGLRIIRSGQKSYKPEEHKDSTPKFTQAVRSWIQSYGARQVQEISGTTQEQSMKLIQLSLSESLEQGLGEREMARRLRSKIQEQGGVISNFRASVISRTEVHTASSAATHEAGKALDLETEKEWISAKGDRTREDHAEADGQVVGMNEPFIVGGEELMYPGDPNGSAHNIINCRCVEGIRLR